MTPIPDHVVDAIPMDALPAIELWWANLPEADRTSCVNSWDHNREKSFFTEQLDAEAMPKVIGGQFVPHDDSIRMQDWMEDWSRYALDHDSWLLREVLLVPVGGVCQSHPAAHAVLETGVLPSDFVCPFGRDDCPMTRLQKLSPGSPIYITPRMSGGWYAVASAQLVSRTGMLRSAR